MARIRTLSFDGVIVGGGGAGMRAALQLESPDGRTWVAYRPATDVFKPYVNPQLDGLGSELDAIFNQLLATLDPWKLP